MHRIGMHRLQDLIRLHRMGLNTRDCASSLQMSPNTERVYRHIFERAGLWDGSPEDLPTVPLLQEVVLRERPFTVSLPSEALASYSKAILQMAEQGATPRAIFDALKRAHDDFTASESAVRRYLARTRKKVGVRSEDVVISRAIVAPGEEAQVDFGDIGLRLDPATGRMRKAYVFVMVLSHSRHRFDAICFDQKVTTWVDLHMQAFEYFGGVPRTIVPDNLKSAVIRSAFKPSDEVVLNRNYRDLARHYGFRIAPTPPYSPEKKGTVESGVKYVKFNFFRTRDPKWSVEDERRELRRWTEETAGMRRHGTTGKSPLLHFKKEEAEKLLPLPVARPKSQPWCRARVHRNSHAQFEGANYSVPWKWIGSDVWLQRTGDTVVIYKDEVRIACHSVAASGERRTCDEHLPETRRDYRHRSKTYWDEQARAMGEDVSSFVEVMWKQDTELCAVRYVSALFELLKTVPVERGQAACRRAAHFGTYAYRDVRDILKQKLDEEPLVESIAEQTTIVFTYARSIQEMLSSKVAV